MLSKFIVPGIVILLTYVLGFWLSSTGKPYNGLIFNLHKLVALAAVVVLVVQFGNALKGVDTQALIIVLLALAGLLVVALFASGALLSAGKLDYGLMLALHRIALAAAPVALALVVYLLVK
jgi:hypothetical protein